jgi:hypothetical protein
MTKNMFLSEISYHFLAIHLPESTNFLNFVLKFARPLTPKTMEFSGQDFGVVFMDVSEPVISSYDFLNLSKILSFLTKKM